MLTRKVPFRGAPSEVMLQHQHGPLPLEEFKDVAQPVVTLLEKDPAQRFRTPNELLRAIPTITGAIEARRRITRQSLRKREEGRGALLLRVSELASRQQASGRRRFR
jgi:hypothetical protein